MTDLRDDHSVMTRFPTELRRWRSVRRLASADGNLRLITTLTSFATAADVTLAELSLEAFLPADEHTAEVLRRRWG
jgi:hypothetical protein